MAAIRTGTLLGYTSNGTPDVDLATVAERNQAIADAELARWAEGPDRQLAYYHFPHDGKDRPRMYREAFRPGLTGAYVSLWPGQRLGTITEAKVYRHAWGGRFVSLTVQGTNGKRYHGRASWDHGDCINLRKGKG